MKIRGFITLVVLLGICVAPLLCRAQQSQIVWSDQEKPIVQQIQSLRSLADDVRAVTTKQLALQIRALPVGAHKVILANALANLSTEGDFGRDTLQEVTTTLADALREYPVAEENGQPAGPYFELAQLVRYEHMQADCDSTEYSAAMKKLEANDQIRAKADFTLTDLEGKSWTLSGLRGKVVVVNFFATWCPPCRTEMPTLETLYNQFKDQGLVVVGISDEDATKIKAFISEGGITYPILLDPGDKANDLFQIKGIPNSFVYDRDGKLVAQSIDMRTQKQFLEMLALAGLK
jgi:peroxiredoxin